jgi:DNA-directed RNA polymerase subunit RPC12/RpoP
MPDEQLFEANTAYVEMRCWQCSHKVILKREQVPANLERRAVCSQCQTT